MKKYKCNNTRPEHEVSYQEMVALVCRHADKLTAEELLAIAANLVGKLMAFQDKNKITPDIAIQIVRHNIEQGNRDAVRDSERATIKATQQ